MFDGVEVLGLGLRVQRRGQFHSSAGERPVFQKLFAIERG